MGLGIHASWVQIVIGRSKGMHGQYDQFFVVVDCAFILIMTLRDDVMHFTKHMIYS